MVELITVIGILAVMASVILAVVNPLEQFNKAQDSRRKSDLAQIQKALEVYYQDYHRYPYMFQDTNGSRISTEGTADGTTGISDGVIDWGTDFRPYMDVLPIDPKSNKTYAYWTDSTGQSYALYASLDRGGKDPQACNDDSPCRGTMGAGISGENISCGKSTVINCTYGITSPNITP